MYYNPPSEHYLYEFLMQQVPNVERRPGIRKSIESGLGENRINRKIILQEFVIGYDCKALTRRLLHNNPYKPTFVDEKHKNRFYEVFEKRLISLEKSRRRLVAAIFLLSANENLWNQVHKYLYEPLIDFDSIRLKRLSVDEYVLFKAAKEVYSYRTQISVNEYCDCELISLATLNLVMTGYIIEYFGFDYVSDRKYTSHERKR